MRAIARMLQWKVRGVGAGAEVSPLSYGRLLAAWIAIRTLAWVVLIPIVYRNAPLDLAEWVALGNAPQWGYPKHPPMPAWLGAIATWCAPGDIFGVYLISTLVSSGCLVATWFLARQYLGPARSFIATIALDASKYLTNDIAEWNNHLPLNLGCAWIGFCALHAIRTGAMRSWIALGTITGLTLLSKYTVGLLLLPLTLYFLFNSDARRHFRTPGPYVAVALALAIFAPHVAWLVETDFLTLKYAAVRTQDSGGLLDHIRNPVVFIVGQAALMIPMFFVLAPSIGRRSEASVPDRAYLHTVFLAPVLIQLLISALTGCQLRQIWGSQLWTFAGIWLLVRYPVPDETTAAGRSLVRGLVVAVGMMIFVAVKQTAGPHLAPKPDREHFQGRGLAQEVNRRWRERCDAPLRIIAGECWAASNICIYSPQRPVVYSNGETSLPTFDQHTCPWTSDEELNRLGGVIVWDAYWFGDDLPPDLKLRFPRAVVEPPIVIPYRTSAPILPARTGVAFIPPAR